MEQHWAPTILDEHRSMASDIAAGIGVCSRALSVPDLNYWGLAVV